MPRVKSLPTGIEDSLVEAIERLDQPDIHRAYWDQNEFVLLEGLIPRSVIEACLLEIEQVEPDIHRNYVPGHKQGGSVSSYVIREKAPAMLALYRSSALRTFFSRLVDAPLMLCPEDDPHACALYYYTKPGDHIGFHYDTSYYKGARYTVLIGLVEQSEHCRLVARVHKGKAPTEISETRIPMEPGTMVVFNGDKLWHAVTPLGAQERRVILTLQYVTDQRMGPLKKLFSNMKDAFAYFGPAALMHRPKSKQTSINDRAMIRSDIMIDHPTLQFLAGAWSASHDRDS
ncbi:MAG: 2OG-Fe(II) oxygenase [Nitrospirae bacterium]|nr:2OG-Fe(II) oxygenase [Nitrospirota bacterium]